MTKIIYAVIDNHHKAKKTCYDIIFKTSNINEYLKYLEEKGIINRK